MPATCGGAARGESERTPRGFAVMFVSKSVHSHNSPLYTGTVLSTSSTRPAARSRRAAAVARSRAGCGAQPSARPTLAGRRTARLGRCREARARRAGWHRVLEAAAPGAAGPGLTPLVEGPSLVAAILNERPRARALPRDLALRLDRQQLLFGQGAAAAAGEAEGAAAAAAASSQSPAAARRGRARAQGAAPRPTRASARRWPRRASPSSPRSAGPGPASGVAAAARTATHPP